MRNYKQVLAFALIWTVIVIIGIVVSPEKTGFNERPGQTIMQLLIIPIGVYLLLTWIITFIRNRKK